MILNDDPHDRTLLAHTHPADWPAPAPAGRYNLVVIGGGPAGLVAALGAAGLGARVALIERELLGGDCLVTGCVPSKAMLHAAHLAQSARDASSVGVHATVDVDFAAVMTNLRRIRADIAPHDSAERLRREGIDVFFGDATFVGPDTVRAGDTTLRFTRALIATGAHAAMPPIPGLADVGAHTHASIFTLTSLPERLVVLGAGVIGCELAQAFARLGSHVTVVDQADRVLPREEPEASALVAARLQRDGVQLALGVGVTRVAREGGLKTVHTADGTTHHGDTLLVALGRAPNLPAGLHAADVRSDARGVQVDDFLQTSNPRIYAAGDVIGQAAFTHAADHHARVALRNALFPAGRARVSGLVIPRVTYTKPEVAAVGISIQDAKNDASLRVYTVGIGETDRGRTDGEHDGYASVVVDGRGLIRGAVIVADQAGELLAPLTLAATHGVTIGQLASTIHPYPTRSEVVFKLASAYNRERLTPFTKSAMTTWFSWRQ